MSEPSPSSRNERLALFAAVVASAVAALLLWAFTAYDAVEGARVTTLRPGVRDALSTAALAATASPLLVSLVAFLRRRWVLATLSLFATPVLLVTGLIVAMMVDPAPYHFSSRVEAADGEAYHFGESSFMQGQLLGIFREEARGTFTVTGHRKVVTNGDNPRMTAKIVRPADAVSDEGNRLYLSPEGRFVVGNRHRNCAYLALDTSTGTVWTHTDLWGDQDDGEVRKPVNTLSPFILIGPDDELYPPDVEDLLTQTARCDRSDVQNLPDVVVAEALRHPNPRVRDVAEKLWKPKD